ncbi:MAG: hypothetical protein AB7G75_12650 [Candidatus Binatia bacterium]
MGKTTARTLLWVGRVLCVAIALWWPAVWQDSIYTPRLARLTGQELRLPDGSLPNGDEERALSIFWAWEHRQFVETRWTLGPYIGLRSPSPSGWRQTIFALIGVWIVFGIGLARWTSPTPEEEQRRKKPTDLFFLPLWRLWSRTR